MTLEGRDENVHGSVDQWQWCCFRKLDMVLTRILGGGCLGRQGSGGVTRTKLGSNGDALSWT